MQFYNKNYTKQEILKRVADMSQLGGIKLYEFTDGISKDKKAAEVNNYGIRVCK